MILISKFYGVMRVDAPCATQPRAPSKVIWMAKSMEGEGGERGRRVERRLEAEAEALPHKAALRQPSLQCLMRAAGQ